MKAKIKDFKTNKMSGNEKLLLFIYLGIFFFVAASIAFSQAHVNTFPTYVNPPDEHARYLVPRFIYTYNRIPSGFDEAVRIPMYGNSYAVFNVFPYIIMALFMKVAGLFGVGEAGLLIAARMACVCMGTFMAYFVYKIAGKVFERPEVKWLFSFAVMFWPQHLFLHTYVNTDSMAMMSSAIIIYAMLLIYEKGFSFKRSLLLAIGLTCCLLSYYNAYAFLLYAVILCIAYFYQKNDKGVSGLSDVKGSNSKVGHYYDYKDALKWAGIIIGLVLIGTGWWYIHNAVLYDGDLFGFRINDTLKHTYGAPEIVNYVSIKDSGKTIFQMLFDGDCLYWYRISFIALFGSMSIYARDYIYLAYMVFIVLGLVLYLIFIPWKNLKMTFRKVVFHICNIMAIVTPVCLSLYYSYTMDYQPQGRYFMPMLLPLMYYVVKGYEKGLVRIVKNEKYVRILTYVIMAGLMAMMLFMVYHCAFPYYMEYGLVM